MDPMTIMAGASAVGNIASSIFGSSKAEKSAKKALKFAKEQNALARGDIAPYATMGKAGIQPLMDALGLGNSQSAIDLYHDSPLYKLLYGDALQEGLDDVKSIASSRSMLNSGATLQGLQDRRISEANKFFGQHVGGLDSVVNRGQQAATTSANLAAGAGTQLANIQSGIGDTQLAGILGVNSGIQGGLGDLASILGQKKGASLYSGGGGAYSPGVGSGGMGYSYYGGPR